MAEQNHILSWVAAQLQAGVRSGRRFSATLSVIVGQSSLGTIETIKAVREAFGLTLSEASPIGGWRADGTGEITHDRLDELVGQKVLDLRQQWAVLVTDSQPGPNLSHVAE